MVEATTDLQDADRMVFETGLPSEDGSSGLHWTPIGAASVRSQSVRPQIQTPQSKTPPLPATVTITGLAATFSKVEGLSRIGDDPLRRN